ncbi:MAG: hypothetical protein FJ151_04850 [Euryarchaeota archaeon]|nr:hypothetical protein [Euryarchaeota archaeon]
MLSKRVGKFWSRCAKRADIPMKNLFPASEYWTKGPGSKEAIVVRTLGRRKGIWYGNASFTGELDPDVTFELVRESERTKDYELTVGRAPREEPFRQVYFRLLMEARLPRFDYFVFLLILTVLLGAICIAGTMFSVVL